jgi:two-component system, chemotaxis family, response regulator PixH
MATALVVDDNMTEQQVFTGCLQRGGFTVVTASSGQDAMTKIQGQKPDVIILDVVLPDLSGFELCRDLKADATTQKIPIVMCSTKGSDMDKFWGMKQGADAYLPKPIDQDEFIRTVKQLVNR